MFVLSIYADQKAGYVSIEDQKGQNKRSKTALWSLNHTQSTDFLPLIRQVWDPSQSLSALVVPRGPASFTTLRATLTIAKGIAFSFPQSEIFSPSQFHIWAFAARHQIEDKTPFFVLLDAFNQGIYGALMTLQEKTKIPILLEQPFFLEKDALQEFFQKSSVKVLVTDLDRESKGFPVFGFSSFSVVRPLSNFAEEQLLLYRVKQHRLSTEASCPNSAEWDCAFDCKTLTPFYGYMPKFKKKNTDA